MAYNSIVYSNEEKLSLLSHFKLKHLSLPNSYQEKFKVQCNSCSSSFETSLIILKKYQERGDNEKLCVPCSKKKASQKVLLKSNVINEIKQKFNVTLIGDFKGIKNKHNFICSCGKTFLDIPYTILKKEIKFSCYCSSKKVIQKVSKEELLKFNVPFISFGSKGRFQKVNLLCEECNSTFTRNYQKLLNHDKKLCQKCLNHKISQTRIGATHLKDVKNEVKKLGLKNPIINKREISYECLSCNIPLVFDLAYLKRNKKDSRFCRACSMNISYGNLIENPSQELKKLLNKEVIFKNDEISKVCSKCNSDFFTTIIKEIESPISECSMCRGSEAEFEIFSFVKSIYNGIILKNDRKALSNLEIDLYLPELKFGIEFHGLWWHSEKHLGKIARKKHLIKFKKASERGIKLIQIFENEWITKKEILKSIIASNIRIYKKKIFARKTEVKIVNENDAKIFLNDNHLQGFLKSSIYVGLYFEDELVFLSSFGPARFSKSDSWEILRSVSKINTSVIGGFSKTLKFFENHQKPKSIISFCDLRFFDGKSYFANNFKLERISNPSYYYFRNSNELYNRFKFQKKKLKKLKSFDENKTEWENMLENGWNRIWDCGNFLFIKKI